MRRRLLTAMLLIAAVAVLGFGVPLAWSVHAFYRDEALLVLSEQASGAAVTVPLSFGGGNDLPELPAQTPDVSVALYDATGNRVLGSGPAQADAAVLATLREGTPQRRAQDYVVAVPINNEATVVGVIRASSPPGAVTRPDGADLGEHGRFGVGGTGRRRGAGRPPQRSPGPAAG